MSEQSLSIWDDASQVAEIKKLLAPTLSDQEFNLFMQLGRATGLNPFLREIWAVKYGNAPAQNFIGRDGYRKAAIHEPEYDYHYVEAIYDGDQIVMMDGEIKHTPEGWGSGNLLGAYCVVKRKSSSRPTVTKVRFSEYVQPIPQSGKKTLWQTKPETMIKKVAEAQALRAAFPSRFNGSYDESEQWEDPEMAKKPRVKVVASTKQDIVNPAQKPAEVVTEKPRVVLSEVGEQFGKMLNAYLTMCGKDRAATLNGLGEKFQVKNWGAVTDDTYKSMMATLEVLSKEESAVDPVATVVDVDTPPAPQEPTGPVDKDLANALSFN